MDLSRRAAQLALIERRWPGLWGSSAESSFATGSDGAPRNESLVEPFAGYQGNRSPGTLRVRGIQLSSRYDRVREAAIQAETLVGATEVTVYGVGLGDLPRQLLERPELTVLRWVPLNWRLFEEVLAYEDLSDILADERVTLLSWATEAQVGERCFVVPPDLSLAEDGAWKLRDRLLTVVQADFVGRRFLAAASEHDARLRENERFLAQDRDVGEVFGSAPGQEVWVIGAGPTLSETMNVVVRAMSLPVDQRPIIVAVDTALRSLARARVEPDYVVAIDPFLDPAFVEVAYLSERVTLVYFPLVPPAVLEGWPGRRLRALSLSPTYAHVRTPESGVLWTGGSVIHPATDLAVRLGAAQVRFFGVDFAFVGGRTHAGFENAELGKDLAHARHWVKNGRGEKVPSSVNFASYLCALEDYIRKHPSVRFANSSDRGAVIAGVEIAGEAPHA